MRRFTYLAVLGLCLVLSMAGTASALTLDFESGVPDLITLPLNEYGVSNVQWSDDGGGHLFCNNSWFNNTILFNTPTYVSSFQMNGLPWESFDYEEAVGWGYTLTSVNIAAFNADDTQVWSAVVDLAFFEDDLYRYSDWTYWLTVAVETAGISTLVFYAPHELNSDLYLSPSIDNLIITEVVPLPASFWLLATGLVGLVGLRTRIAR